MDLKLGSAIALNNKTLLPRFGLGVYQIPPGEPTVNAVMAALKAGYVHIDTARLYGNEASVGQAVRESGIPRDKIWVTTKLWPADFLHANKAFETSFKKLDLDYIDLYLVHFPVPGTIKKIWKDMEAIYATGKVKAIGVSNYNVRQLQKILDIATIPPSVNQVRCSVFGYDKAVYELCQKENIAYEAYSPLTQGRQLNNPQVEQIGQHYDKSVAQVLLRWCLQKNMVVIPKSQNPQRIIENANVFDFVISETDMQALDTLSS